MNRITAARIAALLVAAALPAGAVTGCGSPEASQPPATTPPAADSPSTGARLAPGYYELEDGVVQALGTVRYSELEGGFWLLVGAQPPATEESTIAVIANGADFESELRRLEGQVVLVTGTKPDGVSIRMAGPEITATKIEQVEEMVVE